MTVLIQNTATTNTFDFWRNRTNELATAMSTVAVTVNSNTAVGNAAISGSFAYGNGQIYSDKVSTVGVSSQIIDSYLKASYRSAEYIISVKDNNANNFYTSKMLVAHDGNISYTTEYAALQTNTSVGTFVSSTNTTAVILSFTPVSSNTTVTFNRIAVAL